MHVSKQLGQALLELRLQYPHARDLSFHQLKGWKKLMGGWEGATGNQGSSYYHADVSSVLTSMGIQHENEKVLEHGLMVDIYIANKRNPRIVGEKKDQGVDGCNHLKGGSETLVGLVIEVDGPNHFESYLREPLGPTVMKRRHLRGLGYEVLSISCFEYKLDASKEEKILYLRKVLKRSKMLSS